MAYTIVKSNGQTLTTISDGTVDNSSTSLVLIGKNYAGYGQFLNDDFIHLLENFANSTSPANPMLGQLWWDTTNNLLKVCVSNTGTPRWKISTGSTSSPFSSPPTDTSALGGDLWFDTTNQQLKVYSGSAWVTVGPLSTPVTSGTSTLPTLMTDTSSGTHVVIQFVISNTVYCIFSKDTFTSSLPGFTNIVAGINFSTVASPSWALSNQSTSASPNTIVQRDGSSGITVNAIQATAITASSISASSTITGTFAGNIVGNVSGSATTVSGISSVSAQSITAVSGYNGTVLTASQPNITTLGNLTGLNIAGNLNTYTFTNLNGKAFYNGQEIATLGNIPASFSSINNTPIGNATPSTGAFTTLTASTGLNPVSTGVINMGTPSLYWGTAYINSAVVNGVLPSGNLTANIGSTTSWFNNIFGKAIQAQYADLAERFHADAEYPAGTVVEMGGPNEITKVVEELSDKVFGVISTNAAYLMNSSAGNDATHPPIAMSGRVPVRVIGLVSKGERLVSAGNGLARAGKQEELTPWNVIGRSLVNKLDANEGLIEAIVKINS